MTWYEQPTCALLMFLMLGLPAFKFWQLSRRFKAVNDHFDRREEPRDVDVP